MNEATNKMRNSITSTLCFVLLCSAMFPGSITLAAAQKSGLDGTYVLDETDSDNVNEAIEEREYGRVIMMIVPGADDMQLYQPIHKLAYNL